MPFLKLPDTRLSDFNPIAQDFNTQTTPRPAGSRLHCIFLHRAEGAVTPSVVLFPKHMQTDASLFSEADSIIRQWENTAPTKGGYDKCDICVYWRKDMTSPVKDIEQLESYTFRLDIYGTLLQKHQDITDVLVRVFCFNGGLLSRDEIKNHRMFNYESDPYQTYINYLNRHLPKCFDNLEQSKQVYLNFLGFLNSGCVFHNKLRQHFPDA